MLGDADCEGRDVDAVTDVFVCVLYHGTTTTVPWYKKEKNHADRLQGFLRNMLTPARAAERTVRSQHNSKLLS